MQPRIDSRPPCSLYATQKRKLHSPRTFSAPSSSPLPIIGKIHYRFDFPKLQAPVILLQTCLVILNSPPNTVRNLVSLEETQPSWVSSNLSHGFWHLLVLWDLSIWVGRILGCPFLVIQARLLNPPLNLLCSFQSSISYLLITMFGYANGFWFGIRWTRCGKMQSCRFHGWEWLTIVESGSCLLTFSDSLIVEGLRNPNANLLCSFPMPPFCYLSTI